MNKKKKFVADGLFFTEVNEFLQAELQEDGYAGVEVRQTTSVTQLIIRATKTKNVLGDKGRRIRELEFVIAKRFGFREGQLQLYAERVDKRGLSAIAQAESLRYKLLEGMAVRRACYGVLRFVMDNEARGCEVQVSGKLRAQRAKLMKFRDGYMIKAGSCTKDFVDEAVRHVPLRQGMLGVRVVIMLPYIPGAKYGSKKPQPDVVRVIEPKEDT